MGTGSFPGVKCGRGVLLTTHPLVVPPSLKIRATYTSSHPLGHTGTVTGSLYVLIIIIRRSQWPRGLSRGSAAARMVGLWV